MQRTTLTVALALLFVVGAASIASAVAFDHQLTSTLTDQIMLLDCSVAPADYGNVFNYTLFNPEINTSTLSGFTLQFPGVSTGSFVVTQTPTGWVSQVVAAENKINWRWNLVNTADELDPGEAFRFGFATNLPYGGSTASNASAQDGFGFSGKACGPAPLVPEPSTMLLGLMGLGSFLGVGRFRKK